MGFHMGPNFEVKNKLLALTNNKLHFYIIDGRTRKNIPHMLQSMFVNI